jgi:hypothetical protein
MILTDTGSDYEPIPAGFHPACCINIFDLGMQRSLDGYPVRQCVVLWELGGPGKKSGEPFTITHRYTASLNEKANLRRDLESWRGRAFTAAELEGFNTDKIVGVFCRLNLVEKIKEGGKRRVDVTSVLPPEPGKTWTPRTPRTFIPDWVAKAIAEQLPPAGGSAPAPRPADEADLEEIPF